MYKRLWSTVCAIAVIAHCHVGTLNLHSYTEDPIKSDQVFLLKFDLNVQFWIGWNDAAFSEQGFFYHILVFTIFWSFF